MAYLRPREIPDQKILKRNKKCGLYDKLLCVSFRPGILMKQMLRNSHFYQASEGR